MIEDEVMYMTEDEVKKIEKEIYRDLSPIREASKQLDKKLPIDAKVLSDEAWHFFHFETNDYATMKRTIEIACENHRWESPAFFSMEEWMEKITKKNPKKDLSKNALNSSIQNSKNAGNPLSNPSQNSKSALTLETFKKGILKIEEIKQNRPVFVYDTSSSKSEKMLELFVLYCSQIRREQSWAQMTEKETKLDFTVPYYNRLFFVSYGSSCKLPTDLKNSLYTISYSPLVAKDFRCLLWEFHLRKEKLLQQKMQEMDWDWTEEQIGIRRLDLSDELLQWYADSMSGLEELQVRKLMASIDAQFISDNDVDYTNKSIVENVIVDYKKEVLKQHGRLVIEKVDRKKKAKEQAKVVGLDAIENWLEVHEKAIKSYKSSFSGILLVGIPGTGKSAVAKETARKLDLTLVRLDMSRILGGRVGDSEAGMRETLQDLKFVAPCVLWIDEVEKAMSGANGKSSEGSSTITRLFGMLLTFIQENDRPVFIVTTANDISSLPPEFFRNGRFDQTFCLMMPEYDDCVKIMRIKLNKYAEELRWNKVFDKSDASALFDQCVGTLQSPRFLTGADIEAHVKELFHAYKEKKKCPELEDMKKQIQ